MTVLKLLQGATTNDNSQKKKLRFFGHHFPDNDIYIYQVPRANSVKDYNESIVVGNEMKNVQT